MFALTSLAQGWLQSAGRGHVVERAVSPRVEQSFMVASVQIPLGCSVQENVEKMVKHIQTAAAAGASLVVMPEAAVTGYDEASITAATAGRLKASIPPTPHPCTFAVAHSHTAPQC